MPRKPAQTPSERLREVVLADYELAPHELLLLDRAAHTAEPRTSSCASRRRRQSVVLASQQTRSPPR